MNCDFSESVLQNDLNDVFRDYRYDYDNILSVYVKTVLTSASTNIHRFQSCKLASHKKLW